MRGWVYRSTVLKVRNSKGLKLSCAPCPVIPTAFLQQGPAAGCWALLKSPGEVHCSQDSRVRSSSLGGQVTVLRLSPVLGSPWATFLSSKACRASCPLRVLPLLEEWLCSRTEESAGAGANRAHLLNRGGRRESGINLIEVWNTRCE